LWSQATRRTALPLALALVSLGFAPAPFPRAKHRDQQTPEERAMRACEKRLDELGVRWQLTSRNGRDRVTFRSILSLVGSDDAGG
jgi:hypothetical protein